MKKQNLKKILIPLSLTSAFIPLIGLSATFNDNPTLPSEDHITPTDKANKTYDWEKQYTNLLNWENKVELNATLKTEVNRFYTSKLYNDLYKTVLSNDFSTSFIETDYKEIVEHIINKHTELLGDRNITLYYTDYEDWKDNDSAYIQLKTNIIRTIEAMVLKNKIENDIIIPMTSDIWNYDDLNNKRDILLSDLKNIKDAIETDDYSALIAKINTLNTKSNEIKELENSLNIENNAKDLYNSTTNNDLKVALKNANDSHKHNLDLIEVYVAELKKEKVDNSANSEKGWNALKMYRDILLERYKVIMENGNSLFNTVNNDTSSTIRNVILNKVGNILNSLIFTEPVNKTDAFMSLHTQYLDTIANTLSKAENILSLLKTYKDINQNNDKLDLAIDNLDNSNKLNDPDAKIYEINDALREVLLGLEPNTPPVDNSQSLNYLQQTLNYYKSVKVALDTFKDKTLEYFEDDKLTELLNAYQNALSTQITNLDTNKDNLEYLSQNISVMIADFHTLQHLLNSLTHFKAIINDKQSLKDTFKANLLESAKKLDNNLENTPLIINSAIVETLKANTNNKDNSLKDKESWSKILNDRFNRLEQKHSQILDIIKTLKDNNVKVDILEVVANDIISNLEKSKKLVFNNDKTLKDDVDFINANEMLNLLDTEIAPLNNITDILNEALEHFKNSDLTLKEFNKELANSNEKLFNKKYQKALLKALNKDLKANNADTTHNKKLKGKNALEIAVLISLVFMLLASISLLLMLKNRK